MVHSVAAVAHLAKDNTDMALVDPNIAMGYRGIEVPNQLAQYAQIQQIQGGRQAQEMNALKMQEAQAAMQERNALRQLNPSADDYEAQLFKVNPSLGIQYRKEAATTAAQKAAQATSEFELKAKQRKFGDDLKRGLSANPSDENIIAFGQDAVLQGLYTPDQVNATVQQLLTLPVPERVRILSQAGATPSELKPTINVGPTGIVQTPAFGGAATVVPGTSAAFGMTPAQEAQNKIAQGNLAVSQGQLGLARQRLAQEAQGVTYQVNDQGDIVALPSRLSAGASPVARPVTGQDGAPIKGAPKSKDISVSEQQASYNIARVLNAADEIGNITKKDPKALAPGALEAAAKAIGAEGTANTMRSTNRQIVNGAQRDALDALLYLATGAAYNKEQLQGAFEAYIPSYTDDKGTRDAKQARMTNLIQDAKVRAGKAWTPKMDSAMQSLTGSSAPAAAANIPAPSGVDAAIWNVMTPEERKLWAK